MFFEVSSLFRRLFVCWLFSVLFLRVVGRLLFCCHRFGLLGRDFGFQQVPRLLRFRLTCSKPGTAQLICTTQLFFSLASFGVLATYFPVAGLSASSGI